MTKRSLLFKVLDGTILALICYKVLQILFRIYAIVTITRVTQGSESTSKQIPFIMEVLKVEHITDYIIIILFLILLSTWFYIKYRNAHLLSHLQLTYKPIWALFSFIIPIFNLVAPYKIMNDLWIVQNKDMSIEQNGKNIIKTWWILSIIIFIASRYLNIQASHTVGIEGFLKFEYYFLFFYAVSLHYFLVTRKLVKMIGE
ncbi:MAG TPA: DUF4328 domain-containing protein [Bacteroidia bacterium]|nr:DUF4328 domain-containing protein [Bacteroidia bacterium]